MTITNEQIIETLGKLNALELKKLADAIKHHFDIKEMAMGVAAPATGAAAKPAASEYDVKIKSVTNKLAAIKCLREKDWAKSDLMGAKTYLENDARPNLSEFLKTLRGGKKFSEDEAKSIVADLKAAEVVAEVITV